MTLLFRKELFVGEGAEQKSSIYFLLVAPLPYNIIGALCLRNPEFATVFAPSERNTVIGYLTNLF